MRIRALLIFFLLASLLVGAAGCRGDDVAHDASGSFEHNEIPHLEPVVLEEGERLRVVATTSIVADVVARVAGEEIELVRLLPLGADPHAFEPTPRDVAAVSDAHVIFVNGAGLEAFMDDLLESAGEDVPVVPLSVGIELLAFSGEHNDEHEEEDLAHESGDPHTWFDPGNVRVWVENAEQALAALDPERGERYSANAAAYTAELVALDAWIREQVAQIPEGNRRLVTDHTTFSYFAEAYGFEQVGAIFPGYSTLSEPSAQELAVLEDAIERYAVPAIFVGKTVNPRMAEQVAGDTGVRLVFLYTGSLSEPGGPAGSYLDFMRYNVAAIVEGLR